MFETFHSIENLPKVLENVTGVPVVITEKIHGTSFRFQVEKSGAVTFGSRNQEITPEDKVSFYGGGPIRRAQEAIKVIQDTFHMFDAAIQKITVFGEWAGDGVLKEVKYGAPDFYVYDIRVNDEVTLWDSIAGMSWTWGLKTVPFITSGTFRSNEFDQFLGQESILGKINGVVRTDRPNLSEGVVIRPEPILRDEFGGIIIAKHKNFLFREKKQMTEQQKKDLGPAKAFAEEYVTEGRLSNITSKAEYPWIFEMADMRELVKAVPEDIIKEEAEEFAVVAAQVGDKEVRSEIVKRVGYVWKLFIMNRKINAN
jgi:Rnl2 family RNA ligase